MRKFHFLCLLLLPLLYSGCKKETLHDDALATADVNEGHGYITKEAPPKLFMTRGCIVPNGTCPQQRCMRDSRSDCRRQSTCKCISNSIIKEHYPYVTPEVWPTIDHGANREFMFDMWKEDPGLFYHPDSIPKD